MDWFLRERSLFFHININSDLPKIDELWYIAKLSEEAVKLQSNLFWQWGGVVCFLRNDLSYNMESFFSSVIENILRHFLPHSKPFILSSICYLPNQGNFTEIIISFLQMIQKYTVYNLFWNKKCILCQTNTQSLRHKIKNHF